MAKKPQNQPIEDFECTSPEPGVYRLSWNWREGIARYLVRWRKMSERGEFVWQAAYAKTTGYTLRLGTEEGYNVEIYAEDIWGERSTRPLKTTCQIDG